MDAIPDHGFMVLQFIIRFQNTVKQEYSMSTGRKTTTRGSQ